MPKKGPIEYEIKPENLNIGKEWVDVTLKNITTKALFGLNVKLNSMDTFGLEVLESSRYLPLLGSGQAESVFFRVESYLTTNVYITIDSLRNGDRFHWESPARTIRVGEDFAELIKFNAGMVGGDITTEASVKSFIDTVNLTYEVWAQGPDGAIEEMEIKDMGEMKDGEVRAVRTGFEPNKKGLYTIDAYLYDGPKRLSHRTDYV